jgi:glycosyltransferase involved in cell wall biosynthesis
VEIEKLMLFYATITHMKHSYAPDHIKTKEQGSTFSLVIETENLGMAGLDDLRDTLNSLKAQTYPIEHANEVLVIAAGHVSPETFDMLRNEYPWTTVHRIDEKLEYIQSKKRGAEIVTGDVVLFADSDVVYDTTWLENILYGFITAPGATIVTGETRIRNYNTSLYAHAIQLVWMMNMVSGSKHPVFVQHFHLNNFAIKRQVFLQTPNYLGLPIYRAHTVEMKKWLFDRGYSAVRVPNARGYHLPPGNFMDWWYRMLVHGADAVVKADFDFHYDGTVTEKFRPLKRLIRIPLFVGFKLLVLCKRAYVMIREDWKSVFKMLISIPIFTVCLFVMFLGLITSLVNRDYLFKKASAREGVHVV